MEQLVHFSHDHPLKLVQLQPYHNEEEGEEEEEEEDVDEFVVEDHHVGQCNMCKEDIYSFHLCYYTCKNCNYSLHKFCAEIPITLQDHPLHDPNHNITLSERFQDRHPFFHSNQEWTCGVCNHKRKNFFNYHCSSCKFNMDIICATMSQQKIDHPSHHHQLQRNPKKLVSICNACGCEHEGIFYHCTICYWFWIHQDCAFSPTKLLIQQPTNHSHPLTLTYSFPNIDQEAKFYPKCRICDTGFYFYFWIYKCDKCRYYVHIHCASSKYIHFLRPGRGKICKNFKDEDHSNLLYCPFPDESYNLLKHHFINNQKDFVVPQGNHGETLKRLSDEHPLILLDSQTSLEKYSVLLHNPLKKIKLLCDGCVKPITKIPFYKCVGHCGFVLHEWCARLPREIKDHPGHPYHTLFLMLNINELLSGVFGCKICMLPSSGFGYGCRICEYYVDVNCAFLPIEIMHEAHPDHLLSRIDASSISSLSETPCDACGNCLINCIAFFCPSCDFYLDTECAFMLPGLIRHKYDKHPLTLRYNPVENHPSAYFCEICEDEFNPEYWFYHCSFCVQSMHTACAPVIFQCEQAVYAYYKRSIFHFLNVKFETTRLMVGGVHPHLLKLAQGMECHGQCDECGENLQYRMIFECLECKFKLHYECHIVVRLLEKARGISFFARKIQTTSRQIKKHTYSALP
ncbi:unnamed protein product [Lactuca saligna]|uniref:DC1 domain-containing protein n=1 Tax=Lactuca saligna TaxID=75948 RepID=A0AA36EIN4_LACSI|nr:unnamed protein product [Lactuca saligna]